MDKILKRLEELRQLKKGWLDGEGDPISEKAITKATEIFSVVNDENFRNARIYPDLSGNILVEKENGDNFFTMDIGDNTVEISILNLKDSDSEKIFISNQIEWILKYLEYAINYMWG